MIEDIIRAVLGMPPGAAKINRDLAAMREITAPMRERLIPWEEDRELELMSLKMDSRTQKIGVDKVTMGSIQSIYFEPMVVFAYKDYVKGSREALLYCRTQQMEFVYRLKKRDTDVFYNGNHVAVLDSQQVLHGRRSGVVLGKVRPYGADMLTIMVQDREAGHLFNPSRPHSDVQRAFYLLNALQEDETGIFLAMGFYELIIRMLANKKKK